MRELAALALLAAVLGLVALAVFVAGDRTTLVSPPEVVAEEFVRRLAGHRTERARDCLSERSRPAYSTKRLAAWFRDIEADVDPIEDVEGKDAAIAREESWATVAVSNGRRKVEVRFSLVRERGEWRVGRLPDFDEFAP